MTSLKVSSSGVSLRWIVSAWFLFRSSVLLWMMPAAALITTSFFCGLLMTGYLHPAAHLALSLVHTSHPLVHSSHQLIFPQLPASLQPEKIIILFVSFLLLLLALAANTAMTGMANCVVRGGTISVRDLFRFSGFGATSLALGITLLASVAGSLVLFVGSIFALGLLLASQSAAVRTRRFLPALRASATVIRCDPARALVLAAFVLLTLALGIATGGLGLLVVIPVVKIIGAFADMFAEAREDQQNQGQQNLGQQNQGQQNLGQQNQGQQNQGQQNLGQSANHSAIPGAPLSPASTFTWTQDEELMLRRMAPPVPLSHRVASGLVILLSAYLFLPDMPPAPAGRESSTSPLVSVVPPLPQETDTQQETKSGNSPGSKNSPGSENSSPVDLQTASPVPFVESYGPDNFPDLPCQMHWGDYTVKIEQIGSYADPAAPREEKLTVFSASGLAVYTITDEGIGLVKLEPLLGGPQPELFVHTSEGGDGTAHEDMALTQQGGVHDLFLVSDDYSVQPLHTDFSVSEEIVIDAPLDVPVADLHHYPVLTSTYRWNGREFENATRSVPGPTEARIMQFEQDLAGSTSQEEEDTIGLLANVNLLGKTSLPAAVVHSVGFQSGVVWLHENKQYEHNIVQAVADAKKSLPKVSGNAID